MSNLKSLSTKFFLASTILAGIFLVTLFALIWMIPMYKAAKRSINDGKSHTSLGVCMFFFGGIFGGIAGILMMVAGALESNK